MFRFFWEQNEEIQIPKLAVINDIQLRDFTASYYYDM